MIATPRTPYFGVPTAPITPATPPVRSARPAPPPLFGHAALREHLRVMRSTGALPASLLLHGPASIGKQRVALWLGQLLLCAQRSTADPCLQCENCRFSAQLAHPDLHWYFPRPRLKDVNPSPAEVRQDYATAIAARRDESLLYAPASGADGIFVATVRTIVKDAGISPAMAKRKVFIIGDADRMVSQEGADQAANAFLKLLEEPLANTTIILTSSEPGALLPTIRSRVVSIRMSRLTESETRAFLRDPIVAARASDSIRQLELENGAMEAFLRGGAPGLLLAAVGTRAAFQSARSFMADALSARRSAMVKASFALGATGARAAFSDFLDALTEVVHAHTRSAVAEGNVNAATKAAAAISAVEDAKQMASGNISPQLIGMKLVRSLSRIAK